jgi:hypothetical protein
MGARLERNPEQYEAVFRRIARQNKKPEVGTGNNPDRIRYGCFLPDLTGFASAPSAAGSRL